MKVHLQRTRLGYIPDTEVDLDILEKVPVGSVIVGEFKLARNPAHHRKAFLMLHRVFENQERFPSFERFYDYVKIAAGITDTVIGPAGEVFYKLRSLSFADMDQIEFDYFYQKLITVAYEKFNAEWVLTEFA